MRTLLVIVLLPLAILLGGRSIFAKLSGRITLAIRVWRATKL
jgi:hypothetical protein